MGGVVKGWFIMKKNRNQLTNRFSLPRDSLLNQLRNDYSRSFSGYSCTLFANHATVWGSQLKKFWTEQTSLYRPIVIVWIQHVKCHMRRTWRCIWRCQSHWNSKLWIFDFFTSTYRLRLQYLQFNTFDNVQSGWSLLRMCERWCYVFGQWSRN